MGKLRTGVLALLAALALSAVFATSALAHPTYTTPCSGCHGGANLPIVVTPVSNDGVTAKYNVSASGATAIAVFNGATKLATINAASGQISVAVGSTYSIFAVKGPTTASGLGSTSVSPVAAADVTAPKTVSNAAPYYALTATITLSATDAGSGVAHTYYILDGGLQTEGTVIVVNTLGVHSLEFWSVDNAPNVETHHTVTFTIKTSLDPAYRFPGAGRYDVADAIARKGWDPANDNSWPGVTDIVVASGDDAAMADPLAAAGLAGIYNAPVLTVSKLAVPAKIKTDITQIAAKNPGVRVHIVGGTGSVPDALWNTIRAIPGVSAVKDRVAGADRYAVTSNIARRMLSVEQTAGIPGVLLVCSENPAGFYDALAASPAAYRQHLPMIGVRAGSIPASVAGFLSAMKTAGKPVYAASGSSYISTAVANAAGATRLTNAANHYAAARDIASAVTTAPLNWLGVADTGVAAKPSDALTGGAFMGKRGGVLLFTDSTSVMQPAPRSFVLARAPFITQGWVFGGTGSVPAAVQTDFMYSMQ